MHNQPGIVAESAVGFREKTQVPMPEELARTDTQVGIQKNFQFKKILLGSKK